MFLTTDAGKIMSAKTPSAVQAVTTKEGAVIGSRTKAEDGHLGSRIEFDNPLQDHSGSPFDRQMVDRGKITMETRDKEGAAKVGANPRPPRQTIIDEVLPGPNEPAAPGRHQVSST